MFLDTGRVLVD